MTYGTVHSVHPPKRRRVRRVTPFRLEIGDMIGDKQSGATADTLGNILNLSSFVVKRRDGRRFLCKFTALIAAAAVSGDKALDVVT